MTILCLYRVYILVGKVPNNRATVVQRCKITCHTSSNSLMVAQHSHLSMRIILRPQKFVHHSCECTQRCTMLVLTIVRPSEIESNDRETQCDRKSRTRSPLNFKHTQKSDLTAGERKIACNESDSSCNVGEPSCECQKAGSQGVLKWSCANCERGFIFPLINSTCTPCPLDACINSKNWSCSVSRSDGVTVRTGTQEVSGSLPARSHCRVTFRG